MAEFYKMVYGLVAAIKQVLIKDVLLINRAAQLSIILWSILRNNLVNYKVRWNFTQDMRNLFKVDGDHQLINRVDQDP